MLVYMVLMVSSMTSVAQRLEVKFTELSDPYIAYGGRPAFGYGASPQSILTYLPMGNGNDYRKWVAWASKYKMNHVRSYPPTHIVEEPAHNIFLAAKQGENKVDLELLNNEYFEELRRACQLMKDRGFFVHLQLWQAVTWKKQWGKNYYNPSNNVNPDISAGAGPGKFTILENSALLAHQKGYVRRILDATGDLGNVYYDIMNEIGNGTGASRAWVMHTIDVIEQWERDNNIDVLITLNDEGGQRVEGHDDVFRRIDLVVKDKGRWDEHVEARREFNKPTLSVRNIDWDYERQSRTYFYGGMNLEINQDEYLQTRGRKYWWRMFMAKVQMAGAYADAYDEVTTVFGGDTLKSVFSYVGMSEYFPWDKVQTYDINKQSENNFAPFAEFVALIEDYSTLMIDDNVVAEHRAAHTYCLQSQQELIIYLESPNGRAGYSYTPQLVELQNVKLADGVYKGFYFHPHSAERVHFETKIVKGETMLMVPGFEDDLAIYVH